jgi:deoxycytidine triphosphate deaminase
MALERRMIDPFAEGQKRPGVISYGFSSYGYDMRVAGEFGFTRRPVGSVLDPKDAAPAPFDDVQHGLLRGDPAPRHCRWRNRWNISAFRGTWSR